MSVELSAVLVTYNSADGIAATLDQLEASLAHRSAEIIVVDNASADGTVQIAKRHIRRGHVVQLPTNIGYGPGLNVGLAVANGSRVLLMNDDIRFDSTCVDRLLGALDASRDIGVVSPRITYPDGRPAPAARPHLPGWKDEWARLVDLVTGRSSRAAYPTSGDPVDVGLLIAACLAGRTQLLRSIGGFNESFFFYGEDLDLCRRLEELRYRRVLAPEAVAVHHDKMASNRRYRGRAFSGRILNARDRYYRIWLSRPSRMLLNAYRAINPADQPFRLRFHLPRAIYDGPSLTTLRKPPPVEAIPEPLSIRREG